LLVIATGMNIKTKPSIHFYRLFFISGMHSISKGSDYVADIVDSSVIKISSYCH